jgi:hypothetical protein
MIVNIRLPKDTNKVNDGFSAIRTLIELLGSKWQTSSGIYEFDNLSFFNLYEHFEYFKYVDSKLDFILFNRSINSNDTKELFIQKERLICLFNPKIQLLIYSDTLNDHKICFYAIVTHLNNDGVEIVSDIDIEELLPNGCNEFNIQEFLSDLLINKIKIKVYEFLKKTIEIPQNLDFERECMKLSHHNDSEKYANCSLSLLQDSIDNLHIEEIEDITLLKQLKDIKKHSKRLFKSLENLQILDLSLKRV